MPKGSCLCGAVQYSTRGTNEGIDHIATAQYADALMVRPSRPSRPSRPTAASLKKIWSSTPGTIRSSATNPRTPSRDPFAAPADRSLFFKHAGADAFEFIAIGTLDKDPGGRPEAHIFVGSKADWYVIEDDLPQHEEYPHCIAD